MLKYDALLFDIDGTLLDFKLAEKQALKQLKAYTGSSLSDEDFRKAYHEVNDRIWLELEEGKITGKELKIERFRRFAAATGSPIPPEDLSASYINFLGKESHFMEGGDKLIRELAEKGYTMGVITNGLTAVQKARLNRPEFQDYFRVFVISEEVGSAKPSEKIFRIAAEKLGVPLSQKVLIIGDSLTSDIAGGIQAGISTCWYNPGKWENQSSWIPDFEVAGFEELKTLLL